MWTEEGRCVGYGGKKDESSLWADGKKECVDGGKKECTDEGRKTGMMKKKKKKKNICLSSVNARHLK